jgi:hypothetical protein
MRHFHVHAQGVRLCLWTAATNGPSVHSPVDIYQCVEPWWNDTDRIKPNNSKKNLSQCHSVQHKSLMWDLKFSRRRGWCSELSSGLYCRVKWLSTDVSEMRTASIIRDESSLMMEAVRTSESHPWWWRQYAPLKRRSTIILHGSTTQKTALNIINPSWNDPDANLGLRG